MNNNDIKLFHMIRGICEESSDGFFHYTNTDISKWFKMTVRGVQKCIERLKKKNLIEATYSENNIVRKISIKNH